MDFPTIEVSTQLPGGSAETVALLVTAPLERPLGQISGLSLMTSSSGAGVSRIVLQFSPEKDLDEASQDVQAALDAARGILPQTLPYPPTYARVNPADPAILTLALTSETLPVARLSDAADTFLAPRLAQVSGVGRVTVQGNMRPAVRLRVDPSRLAAYGLTMAELRAAVVSANASSPKGFLDGQGQSSTILSNDQLASPAEFERLVVAWRDGAPVRLSDLGRAVEGLEDERNAAWVDGRPAVLVDVQRQPGANIVDTVSRLRARLPELERGLPAGAEMRLVADRTETIRASVHEVQLTLVLAVVLVVAVIWLFLGSGRATLVPAVCLPLSLIGTFAAMWWMGYSLDNLSLMALVVATGFVVDDAIVMVENVVRHLEKGLPPLEAALEGARTIAFTLVSLSVSLVAVFIPLLFMQGVVGRLFREFAETLSAAVVVSLAVSLTLTPMMCAVLLRGGPAQRGRATRGFERAFEASREAYRRALLVALRHRGVTLLVAAATLALTAWLYVVSPKGFLPVQDTGMIRISTEAAEDVSFARMAELQRRVAEIVAEDPAVATVASIVGAGTVNATLNAGRVTAVLRPRETRESASAVAARLAPRLAAVPGIASTAQPVQDIQVGSRAGGSRYQYVLSEADPDSLAAWAPRVGEALAALPELRDLVGDQRPNGLRLAVRVDRARAGRLGVTMQGVDDALYDAFGQRQISTIFAPSNQYRVILEASEDVLTDPDRIGLLRVAGTVEGVRSLVPLAEIASITRESGPLLVTRENQFPSVAFSFDLAEGVSLDRAVAAVEAAVRASGAPPTLIGRFAGEAAEFRDSLSGQVWLILAAVVVIYITLGILYESLIHPLTILSTLPSAGIGALLALRLFGLDLTVVGLIGILLLMGIVKKNGILVVDFAIEARRERGLLAEAAVVEACLLRYRPIMMTTLAALLGALPLVLGGAAGAELRTPLGVSIVGGLLLSQLVTLFTTPAVYLALEELSSRRARPAPA